MEVLLLHACSVSSALRTFSRSTVGSHIPDPRAIKRNGVKLIHMRHEQAAAYAADGWARSIARPGVCYVTAELRC
jgi:hypothetical protein